MMAAEVIGGPPRPLAHLGDAALFLVWGPPGHGPRSRVFARELGIEVRFIASTKRRGALVAPLKYGHQAVRTLALLFRRRPRLVLVQSPPSVAVIVVSLYCALAGARFVVDAHSAAMRSPYWTRPAWLYRFLARRAAATIVTNEHFAGAVRGLGGHALVVRDVPTTFPIGGEYPVEGAANVMVVSSFGPDEPLGEVIAAARNLRDVVFHVTGDTSRATRQLLSGVPENVRLTGFLPEGSYYALMAASQAVLCLTTRDHTMQRGACEALSMGKPIITSRWPLLESYFNRGTVHVDNTATGIRDGVREMLRHRARYEAEIGRLQIERHEEWRIALNSLVTLLDRSLPGGLKESGRTGGDG